MWRDREMKRLQRKAFFDGIPVCKNYLTLAGSSCEDIALGKTLCILKPGITNITAVERETEIYASMRDWLKINWGLANAVNCPLHKLKLSVPQDLVFLDFLGNLTAQDSLWFRNDLLLAEGASVGLTILRQTRGNLFIPACRAIMEDSSYFHETCKEIRDSGDYHSDLIPCMAVYVIMLRCYLLPNASYKIAIDYYGELGSPSIMFLFRIKNICHETVSLTQAEQDIQGEISELVKEHSARVSEIVFDRCRKDSIMSEVRGMDVIKAMQEANSPGKRAAATRLLRQYVKNREEQGFNPIMVEAGIKARITRIANGN